MLRSLGVPFCLDDFGAGAADVRLLRALTADIVKLDGSYVPGVARGGRERAFVARMVEIARAAGASVVPRRTPGQAGLPPTRPRARSANAREKRRVGADGPVRPDSGGGSGGRI